MPKPPTKPVPRQAARTPPPQADKYEPLPPPTSRGAVAEPKRQASPLQRDEAAEQGYDRPGTPFAPAEGHDRRNPGPGEPGGPTAGGGGIAAEPVPTIADEQRQRSEDMQRMGVTAYMAQFDTRDPEAQPQTVPGVQHRKVEEHETRTGRR